MSQIQGKTDVFKLKSLNQNETYRYLPTLNVDKNKGVQALFQQYSSFGLNRGI